MTKSIMTKEKNAKWYYYWGLRKALMWTAGGMLFGGLSCLVRGFHRSVALSVILINGVSALLYGLGVMVIFGTIGAFVSKAKIAKQPTE